jgi:hypothetical protein
MLNRASTSTALQTQTQDVDQPCEERSVLVGLCTGFLLCIGTAGFCHLLRLQFRHEYDWRTGRVVSSPRRYSAAKGQPVARTLELEKDVRLDINEIIQRLYKELPELEAIIASLEQAEMNSTLPSRE